MQLTLPLGNYRFRADLTGTQFWSGTTDHCSLPGCLTATVVVPLPVTVTVSDTDAVPQEGLPVYVFDGAAYTGYNGVTDAAGGVVFTLPQGDYRFRADRNGTQFWSGETDHCALPGCTEASVIVTIPVTVTVQSETGSAYPDLPVYAFDGDSYTGYHGTSDAGGQVVFTLPQGDYRFRADYDGVQFWSGGANHCTIPGCAQASVTVTIPVTVTVQDWGGAPLQALPVYAFSGGGYTGYNKTTDASGQAVFTLPQGAYRFRADYQGAQYWSGAGDHCAIPGCLEATVVAGVAPTATSTVTPTPTDTPEPTGTETPTPTPTETPVPTPSDTPTPTPTDAPVPAPTDTPTPEPTATEIGFLGAAKLAMLRQVPAYAPLLDPAAVIVTVLNTDAVPQEGLPVYVFDGVSYTGINGTTNASGQAILTLPDGSYRFRADLNGTQFWSGESNHCTVPGCTEAGITVTVPVTVTVQDTDGQPKEGLPVYAFSGGAYTGYNKTTDASGQAVFTLPMGDYRFRSNLNGTQFWSGTSDHCSLPGCLTATVVVTLPVTVTVTDTDAVPQEGLPVYVFDGAAYTGYNGVTDASGQVVLTLPQGGYRFRSDRNGTQFWSGETDHCALPGCESAAVTVTIPVIVTVQSQTGSAYPDLPVYAFDGDSYTGYYGTSDENGQVIFGLPAADYRFRADYDGVQFWSGGANHCTIPGCLEALVEIPGGVGGPVSVTIDYTYDPLQRLVAADYSTGEVFHYTYDAVGNRLSQDTLAGTNTYLYDIANRLIEVDGVAYTWDDNGNLLDDGLRQYSYDRANRLTAVDFGIDEYDFTYNGLGDRLVQAVNEVPIQYTLDLAAGLTQVLAEPDNAYLYGVGRIGEQQSDGWRYHLGDALGSVRQLTDETRNVLAASSYGSFGQPNATAGFALSMYGFGGEQLDETLLVYLRARFLDTLTGRFTTHDQWPGSIVRPSSLNGWTYVEGNPVNRLDPSGRFSLSFALDMPAWLAVAGAKYLYSKHGPLRACLFQQDDGQWPTDTVDDLLTDFICEYGPSERTFFADAHLTQELARTLTVHQLRTKFYEQGADEGRYDFGPSEFVLATLDTIQEADQVNFSFGTNLPLNITHFLGTFDYRIERSSGSMIRFTIHNETELRSGTRIPEIFGGVNPEEADRAFSIEELIQANPTLALETVARLVETYDVISVLRIQTRQQTTFLEGGGFVEQTFTWREEVFDCVVPPWPIVQYFLSISDGS